MNDASLGSMITVCLSPFLVCFYLCEFMIKDTYSFILYSCEHKTGTLH